MPRVKLPDGTYGVFPDDMSDDAISSVLQRQFPPEPTDTRGAGAKFVAGVTHAGTRALKGVGDLMEGAVGSVPIVGPAVVQAGRALRPQALEDTFSPERLEGLKQAADTGWGRAGEIATDVALTAIPGQKVYEGVRAATQFAPRIFRATLAPAAAGAVPAAAIAPEGEKGEAAAIGAAGGMAGEAAFRALAKPVVQAVRPSRAAETLMEQGVIPTVGQGAKSGVVHGAEDLVAGLPIVGNAIRSGQRRAAKEFGETMVNRADPTDLLSPGAEAVDLSGTPREIVKELHERVQQEWAAALGRVKPIPRTQDVTDHLFGLANDLPEEVGAAYKKIIAKNLGSKAELTGQDLGKLQSDVGKLAHNLLTSERGLDVHSGEALADIQKAIRKQYLGDATAHLNDAYRNFLVMQKAGGYLGTQGEITPRVFQKALRATGGAKPFARGEAGAPGTQELIDAAQILKMSPNGAMSLLAGGAGAGLAHLAGGPVAAALPVGAAVIGASRPGAKAAFGQYAAQKRLADVLRRTRGRQAAMGAAIANPNEQE